MNYFKKIVIVFCIILWPLNLLLNFKGNTSFETIFTNDYQGEQLILRNIHLYPTIALARVFQNKPRIYIYKFFNNLFILTDPNNYFFGLHPEPIPGQNNIFKYQFVAIVFFAYGIFSISKYKYKNIILFTFIPFVLFLSILKNFYGLDLILWIPISLTIGNGVTQMMIDNKKLFTVTSILLIVFAVPELIRSFIR
ncbi:MAG TPA: hypothetical protein VKC53_01585 [Patescibacteria group bacterium]|nr:hypothetical protein [Patescibacteria group bacterium]